MCSKTAIEDGESSNDFPVWVRRTKNPARRGMHNAYCQANKVQVSGRVRKVTAHVLSAGGCVIILQILSWPNPQNPTPRPRRGARVVRLSIVHERAWASVQNRNYRSHRQMTFSGVGSCMVCLLDASETRNLRRRNYYERIFRIAICVVVRGLTWNTEANRRYAPWTIRPDSWPPIASMGQLNSNRETVEGRFRRREVRYSILQGWCWFAFCVDLRRGHVPKLTSSLPTSHKTRFQETVLPKDLRQHCSYRSH